MLLRLRVFGDELLGFGPEREVCQDDVAAVGEEAGCEVVIYAFSKSASILVCSS